MSTSSLFSVPPDFPAAIFRIIFTLVCAALPIRVPFRAFDMRYELALVCTSWREIIWSTPSLWSEIYFTGIRGVAHPPHPLLDQFALCIRRSGGFPLTLWFDRISDGWDFNFVRLIIAPNALQIQRLRCLVYGNDSISEFLTIPQGRFSTLEFLEVDFVNSGERPPSPSNYSHFHALRCAPRLQHAVIRLFSGLHPFALHLPWGQLMTLDLRTTAMSPETLITILHICCMRLECAFFSIEFTQLGAVANLSNNIVVMRALRILRMRLLFPENDTRLFSVLQLPSLQYLWIELHNNFQEWDLSLYTTLLRASSGSMRQLILSDFIPHGSGMDQQLQGNDNYMIRRQPHDAAHHAAALDALFHVVPYLTNLHLPLGLSIDATLLERIELCILLPRLSTLELGTISPWNILSMLRRRHENALRYAPAQMVSPIQTVKLFIPESIYFGPQIPALNVCVRALDLIQVTVTLRGTRSLPLPPMVHG